MFKNTVLLLLLLVSCRNQSQNISSSTSLPIITGAQQIEVYLPILKDKNIGIVANQTSIVTNENGNHIHLVDTLLGHQINIVKVYAPEHGFRGTADAGEHIKDGKDSQTGLPIISLYGSNKKPSPIQLQGINLMIFDLQDVGARFYTYISTLHYVMEACAENNIPVLLLDCPNPNGSIIDGPVLDPKFQSFVGMHPVPILHGMTIGEYARMINGQKWLKNGIECSLTVIPVKNYNHSMPYNLPIKPSPNLPNDQSINLYSSLCLFEGTNVSVGRGTEKQFQLYGLPFLPKGTFEFTPQPNHGAKSPMHNGIRCFGEDLSTTQKVTRLELKWLLKAYETTSDKSVFFNSFFTNLAGSKTLQNQIESGLSETEIRKSWQPGLNTFKEFRQLYLLYK